MKNFPKTIPVFPLSNFIIFPKTTVPLNIFEERYLNMVDDAMKSNKLIGMIQPVKSRNENNDQPDLHKIGCLGKITSFRETNDGRYLIELKGIIRFQTIEEIKTKKKYREFVIDLNKFSKDLDDNYQEIKFMDLKLIFKDLKSLFDKKGFIINWKALEKQSLEETINALSMASPFSLEEKQVLLESENLNVRKQRIAEILATYSHDIFNNSTLQ
tara:strand:- start:639 stop:1280 length:642 start_codon:yes stop_codon:yes gene_type:complete